MKDEDFGILYDYLFSIESRTLEIFPTEKMNSEQLSNLQELILQKKFDNLVYYFENKANNSHQLFFEILKESKSIKRLRIVNEHDISNDVVKIIEILARNNHTICELSFTSCNQKLEGAVQNLVSTNQNLINVEELHWEMNSGKITVDKFNDYQSMYYRQLRDKISIFSKLESERACQSTSSNTLHTDIPYGKQEVDGSYNQFPPSSPTL